MHVGFNLLLRSIVAQFARVERILNCLRGHNRRRFGMMEMNLLGNFMRCAAERFFARMEKSKVY